MKRIGELYRIEDELHGLDPEARLAGREKRSAPLIADMVQNTPVNSIRPQSKSCRPDIVAGGDRIYFVAQFVRNGQHG